MFRRLSNTVPWTGSCGRERQGGLIAETRKNRNAGLRRLLLPERKGLFPSEPQFFSVSVIKLWWRISFGFVSDFGFRTPGPSAFALGAKEAGLCAVSRELWLPDPIKLIRARIDRDRGRVSRANIRPYCVG